MGDREKMDEFRELVAKTNKDKPKAEDVRALRAYLQKNPAVWRTGGDLAAQAAMQYVRNLKAPVIMKESLEVGWGELKDELGYEDAPPLEKLLIEQVVLCWLRHNALELIYTNIIGGEPMTLDLARHWDRKLTASQGRYLRACETLARVRKIIRRTPALQINIATQGGQQVNVANTA